MPSARPATKTARIQTRCAHQETEAGEPEPIRVALGQQTHDSNETAPCVREEPPLSACRSGYRRCGRVSPWSWNQPGIMMGDNAPHHGVAPGPFRSVSTISAHMFKCVLSKTRGSWAVPSPQPEPEHCELRLRLHNMVQACLRCTVGMQRGRITRRAFWDSHAAASMIQTRRRAPEPTEVRVDGQVSRVEPGV